jgi:hypothetical protein
MPMLSAMESGGLAPEGAVGGSAYALGLVALLVGA